MSPLYTLLLTFSLFSVSSYCLKDFIAEYSKCGEKLSGLMTSHKKHHSTEVKQYNLWKQSIADRCSDLDNCVVVLKDMAGTVPKLVEAAEIFEKLLGPLCNKELFNMQFEDCLRLIKPEVMALKTANYDWESEPECHFTNRELLKFGAIVQAECGEVGFEQFRQYKESVKTLPCLEEFKESFDEHHGF